MMDAVDHDTPWLDADEQRLWRRWLRLNALLPGELQRELQADAGLSLPDFDVLVQLTDRPDGKVRVGDLARALNWGRSRVSHHVTRMERRGLVEREDCVDDGRGAFVVLTQQGRVAIELAAPEHVRTVRRLVFDALGPEELKVMGKVVDKVLARLELAAGGSGSPVTDAAVPQSA
jgi:DNA-binding MarR family transcriptional regulator